MNVVLNRALFVVVERDVVLGESGLALSVLQQYEPDHRGVFGRVCVCVHARGCVASTTRAWSSTKGSSFAGLINYCISPFDC